MPDQAFDAGRRSEPTFRCLNTASRMALPYIDNPGSATSQFTHAAQSLLSHTPLSPYFQYRRPKSMPTTISSLKYQKLPNRESLRNSPLLRSRLIPRLDSPQFIPTPICYSAIAPFSVPIPTPIPLPRFSAIPTIPALIPRRHPLQRRSTTVLPSPSLQLIIRRLFPPRRTSLPFSVPSIPSGSAHPI